MYIQAQNGIFYENPIIDDSLGQNRYAVKIVDMEDPVITINDWTEKMTIPSSRRWALKILKMLGIKAKVPEKADSSEYLPRLSVNWTFELLGPIPKPDGYTNMSIDPPLEKGFMAWTLDFPIKLLLDIMFDGKTNRIINQFLFGKTVLSQEETEQLKKIIDKHLPRIQNGHAVDIDKITIHKE